MDLDDLLPPTPILEMNMSSAPVVAPTSGTGSPSFRYDATTRAALQASEARALPIIVERAPTPPPKNHIITSTTTAPAATIDATKASSAVPSARQQDTQRDPLRAMLHFKLRPSAELCSFYDWLKLREFSEENLEFWLVLRNHNLLYKRYRQIKEQRRKEADKALDVHGNASTRAAPSSTTTAPTSLEQDLARFSAIIIAPSTNISTMHVDRALLRKSTRHILDTYLIAGANREINLPNALRKRVRELVEKEGRYDPMIFADVREAAFDMMKKDSYPRYLKATKAT